MKEGKKMKIKSVFWRLCFLFMICSSLFLTVTPCAASSRANEKGAYTETLSESVKVSSRIWELFFKDKNASAPEARMLAVGGNVFGIKMNLEHPVVQDCSENSLFEKGDAILSVDGKGVGCKEDVERILGESGGEVVSLTVMRGGSEIKLCAKPQLSDGKYRLGIKLRDSALGIGTVTYIDPTDGSFGGLGHGVNDSESGELIPISGGDTSGVILGGLHRGECGKPGELVGILTAEDEGDIYKNTECGVFGKFTSQKYKSRRLIEVADKGSVRVGEAKIISTVKNGKEAEYKIEIYDINYSSDGSKSFKIRVTDEALVALTGGIVRGMSGSPIIQDGKLVGAVTHVMVANPREGYGIFIENMLNAAQMPMAKAA
jgi:stage IV sporulation protein B